MSNFNFNIGETKKASPKDSGGSIFIERLEKAGFKETQKSIFTLVGSDLIYVELNSNYYTVRLFTNEDYYQIKKEKFEEFNKKEIKNLIVYFLKNK